MKNGEFVGYLMSRETASLLGMTSNGCMRASSWNRIPLIRMTNVSLEPGTWEIEDLIADTEEGIYMEMNRSWSIDDRRYNFQFGTEIGYEIKSGKLGRTLRNCTYTGITPSSGTPVTPYVTRTTGRCGGPPTAARASPGRLDTPGTGPLRRDSEM